MAWGINPPLICLVRAGRTIRVCDVSRVATATPGGRSHATPRITPCQLGLRSSQRQNYTLLQKHFNRVDPENLKISCKFSQTKRALFQRTQWGQTHVPLIHNLTFSSPTSKPTIKTHKYIILPFVLYGCDTWYLCLSEDWGCLKTGCWGEYLDVTQRKWRKTGEDRMMRSFIIYTVHQMLLGWSSQGGWDSPGM